MSANGHPWITQKELDRLKAAGHVVHVYPRKRIACINGFKYFRVAKS